MIADLENRFAYHKPKDVATGNRHADIRQALYDVAVAITEKTPVSREQSVAITKLEEAMFWANAAIARNP